MRALMLAGVSVLAAIGCAHAQYLGTIQQRWDASDLVCTGTASAPERSGGMRSIEGSNRDELVARVEFETCLKGEQPPSPVRVIGFDIVARTDFGGRGYGYSGPPTGFVVKGRNLLFLRRTETPAEFEVTVPIYQTAVALAEQRPEVTYDGTPESARRVVTGELEAALVQFDANDLSEITYLVDWLGRADGLAELERFSLEATLPVKRDIAVELLRDGHHESEEMVISLLRDRSALQWKRQNAIYALAEQGSEAALEPLESILAEPETSDSAPLRLTAREAVESLQKRLRTATPSP